jgi:UDP-N-acetylglucosamine 1-carboxyvinyltransferase
MYYYALKGNSMQKFVVYGENKIEGETEIQGAKNSVLPMLAAAALIRGEIKINNAPEISDMYAALRILSHLGIKSDYSTATHSVVCDCHNVTADDIPDAMMKEMRSSIFFLGAILGRTGKCRISSPGGCDIGLRPIDMHITALQKMGVKVAQIDEHLEFSAPYGITGAKISLVFPSVGATENIMMAAATAKGTTIITNAAREPEIADLAGFLNAAGAKITIEANRIIIKGVKELHDCEYTAMPDRIAAATVLAAAAVTGGTVTVKGAKASDMEAVLQIFDIAGAPTYVTDCGITLVAKKKLKAPSGLIKTLVYPGFPTDSQAFIMAALCRAEGVTVFEETIFENRYRHVPELRKMGAKILVSEKTAIITGVRKLHGAKVDATDLRGGAGLVIAALGAEGKTEIGNLSYIDRGYEKFEETLSELGAEIKRVFD